MNLGFTHADDTEVSTLQVEQHALTSRDLCTSLAYPLEGRRDFLLVATRYAAREVVHVIAMIEEVQGGLQHTDMRLRKLIKIDGAHSQHNYLDAHLKLRM